MKPAIHAEIVPLPWESDFFSTSSARLTFSDDAPALTRAALSAYAVVQAKVPTDQLARADALAAWGFRLAESEVDLCLPVSAAGERGVDYRVADAADIPRLREAAAQTFSLSRFRAPWYRAQDSARFYAQWVENAVCGTFDDVCLMAHDAQGEPLGWVTLRQVDAAQARIGLLAVWPNARGKGVGAQLMELAQEWCRQRQVTHLWVATQLGNRAALRLYQHSGAQIQSSAYWFYR